MKKLLLISLLIIFWFSGYSQSIVNRSNATITTQDARWSALYNAYIPRYADTTAANVQKGIDSCAAVIFTYDANAFWYRQCNPKKWQLVGVPTSIIINTDSTMQICFGNGVCVTIGMDNRVFATYNYVDSSIVNVINGGTGGCNGVLNGGRVVWSGSGLTFYVSSATYFINCIRYSSPSDSVTLAAADPTYPRFDVIYVDTTGTVNVLTGTPAASPAVPQIDARYQLALTTILINAGATTPSGISNTLIYDENVGLPDEWDTHNSLGLDIDPNQTPVASHGIRSIYWDNATRGQLLTLTTTPQVSPAPFTNFWFKIKFNSFGTPNHRNTPNALQIFFSKHITFPYSGGGVSTNIVLSNGVYGLDTSNHDWQTIIIPTSAFNFGANGVDSIETLYFFYVPSSQGNPQADFYIDQINLQSGVNQDNNQNGIYVTDVFNTSSATQDSLWQVKNNIDTSLVAVYQKSTGNQTITIYNDTTILICSGNTVATTVCDTIINNNVGNIQTVRILSDTTIEVCGTTGCDTLTVTTSTISQTVTANSGVSMSTPTNVQLGSITDEGSPLLHTTFINGNLVSSLRMNDLRFQIDTGLRVLSTNNLILGYGGNVFYITDTTRINGIDTSGWQAGSIVYLFFLNYNKVMDSVAVGTNMAKIKLDGNVDSLVMQPGDYLSLMYNGGYWNEIGRGSRKSNTFYNIYNKDTTFTSNRTASLNGKFFKLYDGANNNFIVDPVEHQYFLGQQESDIYNYLNMRYSVATLNAGNNVLESTVKLTLDALNINAKVNVNGTEMLKLDNSSGAKATINSDSLYLKATAAAASVGYVLTLLNPTTGSSIWSASSGGSTTQAKGLFVEFPSSSEKVGMWMTPANITITSVKAVLVGSSTPSVTYDLAHGSDITSGTAILSAPVAITTTTTPTSSTSFNDATVPAGNYIWFYTTAQSGTVTSIWITVYYTID